MNPLTRTFVRKHRLDAEVFRQAAREHFFLSERDREWSNGACYAILCVVGFENSARRHYCAFLGALTRTEGGHVDSSYLWPLRSDTNEHESLTPRLIALELCALMVEDLSGPATHVPKK